jgi:hypothetical protein
MNVPNEDLGTVLYAAYLDEAEHYATALQLAGEVAQVCGRGEAIDEPLGQLMVLLAETAKRDALLASAKQRWEEAGRPRNDALRAVMDRIAEQIQQIRNELQIIEQTVQTRRDQLAGELDVCNRRFRMQRAYQGKS